MIHFIQATVPKMPLPENTLAILDIENDWIRILDSHLDNYLKPISDYSNLDLSNYPNDLFDKYPYFWDRLHDGDNEYSLTYADYYMAYLYHHLNIDIANILYQNYLKTLQGELGLICYWQKEWFKYVFKINTAKELRNIDEKEWIDIIRTHINSIL